MFRSSPSPSFDEGPSLDSGIGMGSSPRQFARPISRAQSDISNGSSVQTSFHIPSSPPPRHVPAGYTIAEQLQARASRDDGLDTASQTPLPPSRPVSVPSIRLNGHASGSSIGSRAPTPSPLPRQRPGTPLPRPRSGQNGTMRRQDIMKVLETRGRKTPTLMKAPKLQWDLSKPFTPSMSTLRTKCSSPLSIVEDMEENEEVVYDKDDKQDIEEMNELVQDAPPPQLGTPRRNTRPLSPDPRAIGAPSDRYSLQYHTPHSLSDLTEVNSRLSNHSVKGTLPSPKSTRSLSQSVKATTQFEQSRRSRNRQARPRSRLSQLQARIEPADTEDPAQAEEEEEGDDPFSDINSIETARALPIHHITPSQIRPSEIIVNRQGDANPRASPSHSLSIHRLSPNPSLSPHNFSPSTDSGSGGVARAKREQADYEEVAAAVRQRQKEQRGIKWRLKRVWGKVWRVFHRRKAERKDD